MPACYYRGELGVLLLIICYLKGGIPGIPGTPDNSPVTAINALTASTASLSWTDEPAVTLAAALPPPASVEPNAGVASASLNPVYNPLTGEVWLFWGTDQDLVTGDNPTEIYYSIRGIAGGWGSPVLWKTGNGLDPLWQAARTATIFEPGPLWYGNPQPVFFGGMVHVAYGKFFQNQVRDCVTSGTGIPQTRVFEFPHFDFVNPCPPGVGDDNYAYFD